MTARPPRRFPQQWFRPDQPYLKYPSDSNLVWLREAGIELADDFVPESIGDAQASEICDAFGLFGTPEECLARLKRARDESGIKHVFIFPTHTQEGGYDMPPGRGGRLPRDNNPGSERPFVTVLQGLLVSRRGEVTRPIATYRHV